MKWERFSATDSEGRSNNSVLTCSSNITLSLPSYTGSALKRELNFCNGYLSLLYFWMELSKISKHVSKWLSKKYFNSFKSVHLMNSVQIN